MLVAAPNVVTVNPGLPVNNIQDLVALAKQKPGELQYASSGVGTFLHLAGELFKITAGVDILHIPFRGAGPALIDVVGGHTNAAFGSVTSSIPHIRAGKLKPLGVGSVTRSATLPDVPTVVEAGVPGYEAANCAVLMGTMSAPSAANSFCTSGEAMISEISLCSRCTIGSGVPPVATRPIQFAAS